jgi:FixJ family two-component response regulator
VSSASGIVFVVDDDTAFLKAVSRLLRAAGLEVSPFPSAAAFLNEHDPAAPGCLVLDVAMPGLDGLELQRTLAARGCERSIVFITGQGDLPMGVQAMKAGAVNFLTKPFEKVELLAAIREALEKDDLARRARAGRESIERRLASLTRREREVLSHVIAGRLNKQIAGDLGAAEKTVKVHRARVMEKMGVRSVAELVRLSDTVNLAPFDVQPRP